MFDLLLFTIFNVIYNFFDRAQEANIYEIKSWRLRSRKVVGTEKIDIGNLENLLRALFIDEGCGNLNTVQIEHWTLFIDEGCGNLKAVIDGGEVTSNITHQPKEVRRFTWQMRCRWGHFFNKQVECMLSVRKAWLFLWVGCI